MKKSGSKTVSQKMTYENVMGLLRAEGSPKNVEGMARFGINSKNTLGISVPFLRTTARRIGTDHSLASKLWESGVHEARILASMIDNPSEVTRSQMDRWAGDFDSWDLCDQCCGNLFVRTAYSYDKAVEWSRSDREFVKRAGYAVMAYMAVHDKKISNAKLSELLPLIKTGSNDERNFVKKSVNWALRQIGKRNKELNRLSIQAAKEIGQLDSKSAKWIASDALRELQSDAVQSRLANA